MTAGLVDPLRCRWGSAGARFGGRRWHAPVVDLEGLAAADAALAAWAAERRVPKVVVATQTRVLEAAVDTEGTWWPSVPTIAVVPRPGSAADLWALAAVLSAPPVSAWALGQYGGTALSGDAIKLSARQILEIPLPVDARAWSEGAARRPDGPRGGPSRRPRGLAERPGPPGPRHDEGVRRLGRGGGVVGGSVAPVAVRPDDRGRRCRSGSVTR